MAGAERKQGAPKTASRRSTQGWRFSISAISVLPTSRRLSFGILPLPIVAPAFSALMGAVYALAGLTMILVINSEPGGLVSVAKAPNFGNVLGAQASGASVTIALLLVLVLVTYADFKSRLAKVPIGTLHGAAHLALVSALISGSNSLFPADTSGILAAVAMTAACFAGGFLLGSVLFALYLWIVYSARQAKSSKHGNEVFAGQALTRHKNFLRLRVRRDGALEIHALGVDRVCQRWKISGSGEEARARPSNGLSAHRIEEIDPLPAPLNSPSR